jgi:hypothetical protein
LKVSKDITHPKTKEVLVHAGKKITSSVYNHIKQAKVERFEVNPEDLEGAFASAISSTQHGEVIVETNNELTQNIIRSIIDAGCPSFRVLSRSGRYRRRAEPDLRKDTIKTTQEALIEIYRKLRPVIRRRWKLRPLSSKACSSMRASTTSRKSAAEVQHQAGSHDAAREDAFWSRRISMPSSRTC